MSTPVRQDGVDVEFYVRLAPFAAIILLWVTSASIGLLYGVGALR